MALVPAEVSFPPVATVALVPLQMPLPLHGHDVLVETACLQDRGRYCRSPHCQDHCCLVATTINAAITAKGTINVNTLPGVSLSPWELVVSLGRGLQDTRSGGHRVLSTSTPPMGLEPACLFRLGISLSRRLLGPSSHRQCSFQAQIFWNPNINTAGTQAAPEHRLL